MEKSRSYALFIVEGSTDELALGRILSNLVGMKSGNESKFIVMSGDILTESRFSTVPRGEIAPKNARDKVRQKSFPLLVPSVLTGPTLPRSSISLIQMGFLFLTIRLFWMNL